VDSIPEVVRYCHVVLQVRRLTLEQLREHHVGGPLGRDTDVTGVYNAHAGWVAVAEPSAIVPFSAWSAFFHEVAHEAENQAGQVFKEGEVDLMGMMVLNLLLGNPGLQDRVMHDLGGENGGTILSGGPIE